MKKQYQDRIDKIMRDAYIKVADIEAEAELEDSEARHDVGFCHLFWGTKKRILREKYGIDWKSPAERNTKIIYD